VIKHGIDFSTVEEVFADPFRLIIPNSAHSTPKEKRFYAIGHDGRGVLTIRFTNAQFLNPYHRRWILAQTGISL